MTPRHRIDVRGNEIHPPSVWPLVWAVAIALAVAGVLLLLGGSVADAYPEIPIVAGCEQVEV